MNENIKMLKEINIVANLVDKVQTGNIMMALQEIDNILLDTNASVWLKERALSQREAAIATYKNICFETAHPELFNKKEGE
ncbi:MAG: hypothetical protein ACRC8T_05780 [Acidaminococcaceae bacterium]